MKIHTYGKKEFLNLLKQGDYIVSSTPFGCQEGDSKIIIRRKTGKSVNVVPVPEEYSKCRTNAEIKKLKQEIKEELKSW